MELLNKPKREVIFSNPDQTLESVREPDTSQEDKTPVKKMQEIYSFENSTLKKEQLSIDEKIHLHHSKVKSLSLEEIMNEDPDELDYKFTIICKYCYNI